MTQVVPISTKFSTPPSFSLVSSELKSIDREVRLIEDEVSQDLSKENKNNDVKVGKLAA